MTIEDTLDQIKIELLDQHILKEGPEYTFFHDLKTDLVYTQDKLTPLFKGLDGVVGNYNITSGYLSLADAEEQMTRHNV